MGPIEVRRRIKDRTLTAREIAYGKLDVHESNSRINISDDTALIDRIVMALDTNLFYLIYYKTVCTFAGHFSRAIERIERKYFNAEQSVSASEDFVIITGNEVTFVLLKKDRITKKQIWTDLFAESTKADRETMLREVEKQDLQQTSNNMDRDIIPLNGGSPEEERVLSHTRLAYIKYRNQVLDEALENHHYE